MPELANHLKAGEMSDCENIVGKIFFLKLVLSQIILSNHVTTEKTLVLGLKYLECLNHNQNF